MESPATDPYLILISMVLKMTFTYRSLTKSQLRQQKIPLQRAVVTKYSESI